MNEKFKKEALNKELKVVGSDRISGKLGDRISKHTKSYAKLNYTDSTGGYLKFDWGNSTKSLGKLTEIKTEGVLGKDFLVKFAECGGLIENGALKIEASKLEELNKLLNK